MSEFKTKKLVFTVHGIRTFGQWQQRLEKLVAADPQASGCDWDFKHKDYKFFSVFRFINPLTRWIEVRRFRAEFLDKVEDAKADRIYLVGHSFGTHIIANALRGIEPSKRPRIHLIITSGSVLSEWFPWSRSFDDSVTRVVNDCGTRDGILALNAFLPLNSGLAGRFGFAGITDNTLTNRYFRFGHSGYFEKSKSRQPADDPDWFMRRYWVPLIVGDGKVEGADERANGVLTSFEVWSIGLLPRFKWIIPLLLASAVLLLLLYQNTLQSVAFNEETNRLVLGTADASTPEEILEAGETLLEREAEISAREAGWLHWLESNVRDNSALLRPAILTEAGLRLALATRWRGQVIAKDMPGEGPYTDFRASFASDGAIVNLEDSLGSKLSVDLDQLKLVSIERAVETASEEGEGDSGTQPDETTKSLVERCQGGDAYENAPQPSLFAVGKYRIAQTGNSACLFGKPPAADLWGGKIKEAIRIPDSQAVLLTLKSEDEQIEDLGCVVARKDSIATVDRASRFDCPERGATGEYLLRLLPGGQELLFPETVGSREAQGVRQVDISSGKTVTRYRGHEHRLIQLEAKGDHFLSRSALRDEGTEIDRSVKLFAIGNPDPQFSTDQLSSAIVQDARFSPDGAAFFTVSSTSDDPESKKANYAIDVFDTISGPKLADWPPREQLTATLDYLSRERRGARSSCVTSTEGETVANVKIVIRTLAENLKDMRIGGRSCSFTSDQNETFTAIAVKTESHLWIAVVKETSEQQQTKDRVVQIFDDKAKLRAEVPTSVIPELLFVPARQAGEVNLLVMDAGGRFVLQMLADDFRAVPGRCAMPDSAAPLAANLGRYKQAEGAVSLFYDDLKQPDMFRACWLSHDGQVLIENTRDLKLAGWALRAASGGSANIVINGRDDKLWLLSDSSSGGLAKTLRHPDSETAEPSEETEASAEAAPEGGTTDRFLDLIELESGQVQRLVCEDAEVLWSEGSPTLRANIGGTVLLAANLGPSDGGYMADREVAVWDLGTGKCLSRVGDVEIADFAVNGDASIAAVSGDGVTQLWFLSTRSKIAEFPMVEQMVERDDGTIALVSGLRGARTVIEVPATADAWTKTLRSVLPRLPLEDSPGK
jgi:hypothetical protein